VLVIYLEGKKLKFIYLISYSIFSIRDTWETFLLSIACSLLVDSEKSPFYKKLIIPNIGTNYSPDTG
jgi:Zn-dependent M16 (insulinase) family peptidase